MRPDRSGVSHPAGLGHGRHVTAGLTTSGRMEPVRTCVGCRRRGEIQSLLRVVRRGNEILLDRERVAPGRGAWIHPHQSCVEAAVKHKGFNRAFRVSGGLKTSQLEALVTEEKNRLNG